MISRQAHEEAARIEVDSGLSLRCLVAYEYTRGCYAVIVIGDHGNVVLIDEEAVRVYRKNHSRGA